MTIAITTIANNKINGHKTSTARPLAAELNTLRSNPDLSTRIVAAFLEIYVSRNCHHRFTIESS